MANHAREPDVSESGAGDEPTDDADHPDRPVASYAPMPQNQLLTPTAPLAPGAGVRVYPVASPTPPTAPEAWAPDPSGKHQWRWWNGWVWTDHVADDGVAGIDPMT